MILKQILASLGRLSAIKLLFGIITRKANWPTIFILLLINVIPLGGILFLGWKAYDLLLYFWLENVVGGAYYFLKILTSSKGKFPMLKRLTYGIAHLIPYYIFTLVHGVFVIVFYLILFTTENADIVSSEEVLFDPNIVNPAFIINKILVFLAILIIVEGLNYVVFFILNNQYRGTSPAEFGMIPFNRVIILHFVLIFGFIPLIPIMPFFTIIKELFGSGFPTILAALLVNFVYGLTLLGIKSLWELYIYFYADRMQNYTTQYEKEMAIYRRQMWQQNRNLT